MGIHLGQNYPMNTSCSCSFEWKQYFQHVSWIVDANKQVTWLCQQEQQRPRCWCVYDFVSCLNLQETSGCLVDTNSKCKIRYRWRNRRWSQPAQADIDMQCKTGQHWTHTISYYYSNILVCDRYTIAMWPCGYSKNNCHAHFSSNTRHRDPK